LRTRLRNGLNSDHPYSYDEHGNMTSMPHLPHMDWDFEDQLMATAEQVRNDGTAETTFYVYDAAGQRVRKVTENANGKRVKERIYIGSFEIFRTFNPVTAAVTLERETQHVMDDKQRIAIVETQTIRNSAPINAPVPLQRYQLNNHLGSGCVELDDNAALISYEEYHPYGTTAFQARNSASEVSLKRYRYTGKERDEETGLSYHGARYYAPWLGRWTSCDPIGLGDGNNLYRYCHCSPIRFFDPDGKQTDGSKPPLLDRLRESKAVQLGGGIIMGSIAASVPFVGSAAMETAQQRGWLDNLPKNTQAGIGMGMAAMGTAQTVVGLGAVAGGGGAAGGGLVAAVPSGGTSLVLTGGGLAVAGVGAVTATAGVVNVGVGAHIMHAASKRPDDAPRTSSKKVEDKKASKPQEKMELDDETKKTLENPQHSGDPDLEPSKDPANKKYKGGLRPDDQVEDHLQARAAGGHPTDPKNIDIKSRESNAVKGGREGALLRYEEYLRKNGLSETDIKKVTAGEWESIRKDVHAPSVDPTKLKNVGDDVVNTVDK
jgi:RHS repeat-associated protein